MSHSIQWRVWSFGLSKFLFLLGGIDAGRGRLVGTSWEANIRYLYIRRMVMLLDGKKSCIRFYSEYVVLKFEVYVAWGSQISDGAGFLPFTIPQWLPTNGWSLLFTFKHRSLELWAVDRCKFKFYRKNQWKQCDPKRVDPILILRNCWT